MKPPEMYLRASTTDSYRKEPVTNSVDFSRLEIARRHLDLSHPRIENLIYNNKFEN